MVASAAEALGVELAAIAPELPGDAKIPDQVDVDWASVDPHALGELHLARSPGPARRERRDRGAFYTPPAVARFMAAQTLPLAQRRAGPLPRCLDPACGCGSLLIEALAFLCAAGVSPAEVVTHLAGYDRHLPSVLLARVALLLAVRRLGASAAQLRRCTETIARNVRVRDVLLHVPRDRVDCVLMNPPYVRAARGGRDRESIRRAFVTARGAFDLHVPFVELALQSLQPGGAFGLLTSGKLLIADYAAQLRRTLADRVTLRRIVDLEACRDAAPGALVSQVVVVGEASPAPPGHRVLVSCPTAVAQALDDVAEKRSQAELLRARWPAVHAFASEERIIRKMTGAATRPLGSCALVRGGVRGFDYGRCCALLAEARGRPDVMRVLTPGNLRAYTAPADRPVRLAGRAWREPCLPTRPSVVSAALWELFGQPKVVVKGVGPRPTAAWCPDPAALFVAVWGLWGEADLLWAMLALLNSRPAAWLHYRQLATARIPHGSLRIPLAWLAAFPVPRRGLEEAAELARRRVVAPTARDQDELQEQLDRAAACAYDLTEADLCLMADAPIRPVQV